jgi:hypothetical protein
MLRKQLPKPEEQSYSLGHARSESFSGLLADIEKEASGFEHTDHFRYANVGQAIDKCGIVQKWIDYVG